MALTGKISAQKTAAMAAAEVFALPPGGQRLFPTFEAFAHAALPTADARVVGLAAIVFEEDRVVSAALLSPFPAPWSRRAPRYSPMRAQAIAALPNPCCCAAPLLLNTVLSGGSLVWRGPACLASSLAGL